MRGIFDLQTHADLCAKLEHDYSRIQADPSDAFAAFDFVVTAWHLLEWKHPGDRKARDELCSRHPVLRVCEHLAVGAKHFEPGDPKLQSVEDTHRDAFWAKGVWAPGTWAPGFWKDDLVIRLEGEAEIAYGAQLTFPELARLVMAFWRGEGGCPSGPVSEAT